MVYHEQPWTVSPTKVRNPQQPLELAPFNQYRLSVQGCTRGGCLHSLPIVVTTAQAPPQRLRPPAIWKISSTEPHVGWALSGAQNGKAQMSLSFRDRDRDEGLCSETELSLLL